MARVLGYGVGNTNGARDFSGKVLAGDLFYMLMPDSCSYLVPINRLEFAHKTVTGEADVSPEYQIQGRAVGWLNNRLRFRTVKGRST